MCIILCCCVCAVAAELTPNTRCLNCKGGSTKLFVCTCMYSASSPSALLPSQMLHPDRGLVSSCVECLSPMRRVSSTQHHRTQWGQKLLFSSVLLLIDRLQFSVLRCVDSLAIFCCYFHGYCCSEIVIHPTPFPLPHCTRLLIFIPILSILLMQELTITSDTFLHPFYT